MTISAASEIDDLPLDQIRALAAIVDTGSFDGAARALHVTPSAVSQRIKALESRVGRVLLRRARPVTATPSGEAITRLARQIDLARHDARVALGEHEGRPTPLALAVNGDSLATWLLPALTRVAREHAVVFELHRVDQAHSAELLRQGVVMAAVTSEAKPVQGCTSTPVALMRYRPMASHAFRDQWFPDGVSAGALAVAPVVDFDRDDDLQQAYLRAWSPDARAPRHLVPASSEFVTAVGLGFGWGMVPDLQAEGRNDLVPLSDDVVEVRLHWQQWTLNSPTLARVADAVAAAGRALP